MLLRNILTQVMILVIYVYWSSFAIPLLFAMADLHLSQVTLSWQEVRIQLSNTSVEKIIFYGKNKFSRDLGIILWQFEKFKKFYKFLMEIISKQKLHFAFGTRNVLEKCMPPRVAILKKINSFQYFHLTVSLTICSCHLLSHTMRRAIFKIQYSVPLTITPVFSRRHFDFTWSSYRANFIFCSLFGVIWWLINMENDFKDYSKCSGKIM